MRARLLTSIGTVLAAGALAAVLAPAGSAASETPRTLRAASDFAVSENWSGYVASGADFSSVSGSWVQPAVKASSGRGYSAFWVGLGGSSQGSDALEQVGTQADSTAHGAVYYAWYELVPSAPVKLPLSIHPGDRMTGRVTVDGDAVTVSLKDDSSGQSVTRTLTMASPDTSSAEWIAEAPSQCRGTSIQSCTPLPLADFGRVRFTAARATADGHTGPIDDSHWSAQPIALSPAAGSVGRLLGAGDYGYIGGAGAAVRSGSAAGAAPSVLAASGRSFTVTYESSASALAGADSGSGSSASASGYPGFAYGGGHPGYGYGGYPGGGYPGFAYGGGYPGFAYGGGYPGFVYGGGYAYVPPSLGEGQVG